MRKKIGIFLFIITGLGIIYVSYIVGAMSQFQNDKSHIDSLEKRLYEKPIKKDLYNESNKPCVGC